MPRPMLHAACRMPHAEHPEYLQEPIDSECVCGTNQFDTTTYQLLQCTALCRTATLGLGTRDSYMESCYQRPALRVTSNFDQWPLWWYLMARHPTPRSWLASPLEEVLMLRLGYQIQQEGQGCKVETYIFQACL
jgi:hypothetical protein